MKKWTAVVVEDKTIEATLLRQWLESQNIQVLKTFGNGRDFLQWYREAVPIDLLVLDLIMPVQDGFSTFFDLVEEKLLPRTLVVSVENSPAIIKKMKESGLADYIPRPITRDTFVERVKILMGTAA